MVSEKEHGVLLDTVKKIHLNIATCTAVGMFSNKNLPGKGGFKQLLSF